MTTESDDEVQGKKNYEGMKTDGRAMMEMAEALKNLPAEAQARIIRALAVFYDVRLR